MVKWAPSVLFGTYLVVHWLRLCVPNAGGLGLIPGWGTRSHMQLKIPHVRNKTWCRIVRVGPQRRLSAKELMLLTVVLEKTLENPLDCKITSVNPKGNQSWIFIGRTDSEAEAPIRWPTDVKSQLTRKDPDGKEKELTEDKMVGWYQWLNWQVFEQALGDSEGQTPTTGFSKNTELLLFLFCISSHPSLYWSALYF